jgi:hypothetical protein
MEEHGGLGENVGRGRRRKFPSPRYVATGKQNVYLPSSSDNTNRNSSIWSGNKRQAVVSRDEESQRELREISTTPREISAQPSTPRTIKKNARLPKAVYTLIEGCISQQSPANMQWGQVAQAMKVELWEQICSKIDQGKISAILNTEGGHMNWLQQQWARCLGKMHAIPQIAPCTLSYLPQPPGMQVQVEQYCSLVPVPAMPPFHVFPSFSAPHAPFSGNFSLHHLPSAPPAPEAQGSEEEDHAHASNAVISCCTNSSASKQDKSQNVCSSLLEWWEGRFFSLDG